jgi:hypothetical protein
MAICGNCQSQTTRLQMVMTSGGVLLPEGQRPEACPNCRPELFAEPFAAPIDRKVWPEHEAKPYLYERASDGSLRAKDILLADLDAAWQVDPDQEAAEKAIERKRRTRRTTPLEPWEIEQAERAWRPIVKEWYADIERQNQADRDYTEARIEHWKRNERDSTIQ